MKCILDHQNKHLNVCVMTKMAFEVTVNLTFDHHEPISLPRRTSGCLRQI